MKKKTFFIILKGFQVSEIVSDPKQTLKYFETKFPFPIVRYQVYCNGVKWLASCY